MQLAAEHQLKSLLDPAPSDLDGMGFDPYISTLDDIDFSDMDDGHLDLDESSLDLAFLRLPVPSTSGSLAMSSPKELPTHRQQSQVQLRNLQTLNLTSSSTSRSSRDTNSGPRQTSDTPNSPADGIRSWSTQLEELSQVAQRSSVPLDTMLHQSSQLLPRMKDALQSRQSSDASAFPANLMLILVCLTQLVTLFEQCLPSVLGASSTTGSGSADLSLRLGDFRVDRKAQQALQMHIVNKELWGILQVLKMVRRTLLRPDWRNVPKHTHDLLLEDVRVRTVSLVYQMKQKRAHRT